MRTVRLNHLRAVLLAVAAAGLLGAVGLVVFLYAQPAEANYPGKPGKIAYVNIAGPKKDSEIWTIKPKGGGKHRVTNNTNNDRNPYWERQ